MSASQDAARTGLERQELALLSHEIRGALTVIAGMNELLKRELPAEERVRALESIGRAVERIDRLLDDALGGGLPDRRGGASVDLATLAEQVSAEQRAVTGRRVDVHIESRPVVAGSREALERALANLIENGLKYSLAATPVEVTVTEHGGIAVLEVADRGPGIESSARERIFEPFERLDGGGSVPGTGLGLTVVRSVTEAHGGRATVDERAGGGSVFAMELPAL